MRMEVITRITDDAKYEKLEWMKNGEKIKQREDPLNLSQLGFALILSSITVAVDRTIFI
jgi:hypothetical protein